MVKALLIALKNHLRGCRDIDPNDALNLINKIPGLVFWKDAQFRYRGGSDCFIDLVGMASQNELIGKTDYDLWELWVADELRAIDQEISKTRLPKLNIPTTAVNKYGQRLDLLTNEMPLFDKNGEVAGIVGVAMDVTERKQMELELKIAKEAAEQASKAKSEFLENISHDIKTPLSSVIGLADLLINKLQGRVGKEYAEDIKKSASELLKLFSEVLEIVNKNVIDKPESIVFDLKEMIQEIIDFLNPIIREKNIQFKLRYAATLHSYYLGNQFYLCRIILNLLSNAVKFTEPGGQVYLSIKKLKVVDRQETIQISVGDTGVGITKENQKIIFDRYVRLSSSGERKYQGDGIGLYIVKKMVAGMDGSITVKSKINQGSVFRVAVNLPQTKKIKPKKMIKKELTDYADVSFKDINVLLVDNNPLAQKVNKHWLLAEGCRVDIAETGQAAFEKFVEHEYALILMDIVLPDTSGYEVVKKIRKYEVEQNKSPVVILGLTADVKKQDLDLALDSGMDTVFSKPLSSTLTKHILHQLLIADHLEPQKKIIKIKETELPVIDLQLGAEILGSDTEAAKNMITQLVKMLPGDLQNLKAAAGNNKKLQDLAHYIKGGASYCGTPRLQKAAGDLDRAIKNNADATVITKAYEKLCSEIEILLAKHNLTP